MLARVHESLRAHDAGAVDQHGVRQLPDLVGDAERRRQHVGNSSAPRATNGSCSARGPSLASTTSSQPRSRCAAERSAGRSSLQTGQVGERKKRSVLRPSARAPPTVARPPSSAGAVTTARPRRPRARAPDHQRARRGDALVEDADLPHQGGDDRGETHHQHPEDDVRDHQRGRHAASRKRRCAGGLAMSRSAATYSAASAVAAPSTVSASIHRADEPSRAGDRRRPKGRRARSARRATTRGRRGLRRRRIRNRCDRARAAG